MNIHLLHVFASRREILARIEVTGILGEVLADSSRHRQTRVAVDVDLAHRALGRLAKLSFGNADCVGKLAAELVDRIDFILRNRARSVKNDREARKFLLDGLEDIERQRRRNELAGLLVDRALLTRELVRAVARADGDGERIAAGLGREFNDFFRLGIVGNCGRDFVFNASENAELGFDGDIVLVSVSDNLLRELDILGERKVAAVDHDRREARVNAALAGLEAVAMVEVENDLRLLATELLGVFNRALSHIAQDGGVGVLARTLGNLHNYGRLRFNRRLNDGLHLLHRIEVESGDGITALDRFGKHLLGIDETKFLVTDHFGVLLE